MGTKIDEAYVEITSRDKKVRQGLKKVDKALDKTALKAKATGAVFKRAFGVISVVGIGMLAKKFATAAGIQEQAAANLEAVLKATGHAAGFSRDQLLEQAAALQKVTTFGDETTISAQAVLATFKDIKGDTFEKTIELAQDLATVMGTDLKSATLQLGKALNDPITGLTALRRSGVSFTESQQKKIKGLVAENKLFEAQKIILAEVTTEFGGAAKARGKTRAASLTQVVNAWGDVQEKMGGLIIRLADAVIPLGELADALGRLPGMREAPELAGVAVSKKTGRQNIDALARRRDEALARVGQLETAILENQPESITAWDRLFGANRSGRLGANKLVERKENLNKYREGIQEDARAKQKVALAEAKRLNDLIKELKSGKSKEQLTLDKKRNKAIDETLSVQKQILKKTGVATFGN